MQEVVALIDALAWPVVTALAVLFLRRELVELLGKATKVTLYNFSIEFAQASEFSPQWSGEHLRDVRKLTPASEFYSGARDLFEQIRARSASDFAVIDLGGGQNWLDSRLFIFAVLLRAVRGLRCFVFLETRGVGRRFLGVADLDRVRRAIAQQHPWLERSLAEAWKEVVGQTQVCPLHDEADPVVVASLVRCFLSKIQREAPPELPHDQWLCVRGGASELWERAEWLNSDSVVRLLGEELSTAWVRDDPDVPDAKKVKAIVRRKAAYVALVNDEQRFLGLVDRGAVVEKLVSRALD